jgi:outer membrane autotransporter protein
MLYLYNDGTVTGAVDLGGGQMQNNGTWNQSGTSTADVVNAGLVVVGDRGTPDRARLVGDFTQTSAGTLALDVDFRGGRADRLNVTGDVRLDGRVAPLLGTISPGTVPVMTVDGAFSGQPRVDDSALFRFDLTRSGRQLLLSSGADFAPASFGLDPVQRAVAGHLQSIWDQGSTPAFDDLFWQLGLTADADPGAYGQDLRQLSPDATLAIGARGSAAVQEVADRAFSCPVFSGTGAMLTETSCGWVILVHGSGRQARRDGVSGFSIDTTTLQLGGQIEIAPGWLAGGSLAYVEDRFTSRRGRSRGDGQSGYGALTLKHEVGPWLLAAAAFGGYGSFDTRRVIDLPGVEAVAAGTPERSTLGLRLRAAYTLGGQAVYLRPSLEVGALRVRSGAYRERSAGGLGLDVESSARSSLTLTPAIEIGGRIAVDDLLLRPYLRTGVSWRSAADWEQRARLLGAPSGTAGFVTTVPGDRAVARIGAGIQLYSGDNLDLRLQYTGEVSDHYTAHRGSLTASLRF